MNNIIHILTARNVFFASLIIAAIVLAALAPKAAVNVDEQLHYPHAKKVVNWYFTSGKDVSGLDTPKTNLKYYGQSVDNLTALVNRVFNVQNEFLVRHYFGAVFFLLLLLFAGLLAFEVSGSYWVSALTVISVLVTPRLFGQAFGNLKDIPFTTGYLAGIYMIIRFLKELPEPGWKTAIGLGAVIAFTVSVRAGGFILFAYLAMAILFTFILKPFLLKHIVSTKLSLVKVSGQALVILIIGYFGGLLFWPYALQDIWHNPFESLSVMEHYKVSIRQIFEGRLFWSSDLPWYYLPKWILISTPEFLMLGFIAFAYYFIKANNENSEQKWYQAFLMFTLMFPIIYVIAINSNLYSGVRQMLFVMPILAIFSSMGIFRIFQIKMLAGVKTATALFFFALMCFPFVHQAKTFPVDYVYFNQISGGNKKAWSNYEYDYYFHGIKRSSEDLLAEIGDSNIIVATNCNLSNYFENYPNIQYSYTTFLERSNKDWDFGLFGINYIPPELLKSGNWKPGGIEKIYYHKGNPMVVLLKRSDKSDFVGISSLESNNLDDAKINLEKAITIDPNNIWLYAQLAKISLKASDFKSFNRYLQSGKEIYPDYEPLFLLEAQYWFTLGDYKKADNILSSLFEINPRYENAYPLQNAVKEKLNIN